jgi:urease accessory protein
MATTQLCNEVFAANRAVGRIALAVASGPRGTRVARIYEGGSPRIRFPHGRGPGLDAVIVNTAGGMTGGDRFEFGIEVDAGAEISVTTAAAEKIYRSLGPDTSIDLKLDIGPGGKLAWLPQETILFDRARLRRRINVDLARDASMIMAESTVFGRSAMGETVVSGCFRDRWRVRVDGVLVFAESVQLDGGVAKCLAERPIGAGAAAIASVLKIPGNEQDVASIRAMQADFVGEVGASAWNGLALARLVASDGATLRHDLIKLFAAFCSAPRPRLCLN